MVPSPRGTLTFHSSLQEPYFNSRYTGATNARFIRGGCRFSLPDKSSGATQANFFASNGGGWSGYGITLSGALDIECTYVLHIFILLILPIKHPPSHPTDNPYGATCYGLSITSSIGWISNFSDTYPTRVGRYPAIYTTNNW